ncbi:hypothetical protein [Aeromonas hydrophila]
MAYTLDDLDRDALELQRAINAWQPTRPRRWLAKYGGLVRVRGPGHLRRRYLALVREATLRSGGGSVPGEGDYMPEITFRLLY